MSAFLPYCRPDVGEEEIAAVAESLRNGWLTTGPRVAELEAAFVEMSGVRHAVALSSCTAALHVALGAAGVGPGDEVVMPSLTFVAGAQCTLELGATPVFADVDPNTLSVTAATIEAVVTRRTRAIIPMPYAGRPLGIERIAEYARKRGLAVIEDAAHAVGTLDCGHWAGASTDAAAYSFYATKNLTTAEGGVLLTNDERFAERARTLSLHGMSRDAWKRYSAKGSWRYDVVEPGYKYNLADPLAAIGIVQLRRLAAMQRRRIEIAARYDEFVRSVPGLRTQSAPEAPGDVHSYCMYVMLVDERIAGIGRDDVIAALTAAGIGTSVHYIPTHLFSAYRAYATTSLANTETVWQQLISLPLYSAMSDEDVERVISALAGLLGASKEQSAAVV